MTKEEKKQIKEDKQVVDDEYGWAFLDGRKEKVGNFRIEPPGLFRGRGEHPKTGCLKVFLYCFVDSSSNVFDLNKSLSILVLMLSFLLLLLAILGDLYNMIIPSLGWQCGRKTSMKTQNMSCLPPTLPSRVNQT